MQAHVCYHRELHTIGYSYIEEDELDRLISCSQKYIL
jgi:hypothetical protein